MSIVFQQSPTGLSSWQAPPFEAPPDIKLGWIEEQVQEGEAYVSGSRSYRNMNANMQLFDAIFNDKTQSTLNSNFLKYNIRKFVETLSDVREIGIFGSDAAQFKTYAEVENKVLKCIYTESQYPRALREVLQYASVMGVGYLWPKCKTEDYGFGERRIVFESLGLLDVVPVQVPKSNDVQDAYAITVYEYMPIAEAHARFPLYQSQLMPVNKLTSPSRLSAKRIDWAEKFRYGDTTRNWGNLYCEIRYTFIRDLRVNNTGYELPMGDANTSWFYKVPSIGQPIFGGIRNNQPFMRPALLQDCRVYPHLRLMISGSGVQEPMYDGPAFDWHGKMPTVQYTVDDWPWEPLGLSLVESVGSIERTKRKHERRMDQVITTRTNPPMGYDRTVTGGPKIENFNLFEENVRAGMDGNPQQTFQSILPAEVVITDINFAWDEKLKSMEETQLGINDLGTLINAKLNLDSDSFDKALETVGPIAKGIAATMEAGNAKVAFMMKFMIPQWMDTRRIIEYVGPDKVTPEQFDFDPESLVPSHMPDEFMAGGLPFDEIPDPLTGEMVRVPRPSYYDKLTRARNFARNLRLISVPSTLLKITQAQEQTKIMALYGRGFPIPPDYVADKLGVDNWGELPGATLLEKWTNWEKLKIALMAQAQQLANQLGVVPPGGAPNAQTTAGVQHGGGRPPVDQAPPKLEMKDKNSGSPRPIIRTSK